MKTLVVLHLIFLGAQYDAFPTVAPNGTAYIKNGGSLALTCEVDQNASGVSWFRNGYTNILITNATLCIFTKFSSSDTYNYSVTCDQQRRFSMVKYGVNSSDDNTTWTCQVFSLNNTDLGTSSKVKVFMLVPVRTVHLLHDTTLTLIENHSVVLVCETDECRPSAAIYWMMDGINITNSPTNVTVVSVGNELFVSSGTLIYKGLRGDNMKILTCGAYNDVDSVQTSGNLTVIIYYPPEDPPVIEGQTNGSRFTVIENTAQILTCRIIGGNPLSNLSWICLDHIGLLNTSGEIVYSKIVLTVDRNDQNKRCICRTSHQLEGPKDVFVILQVHYPPSIHKMSSPYKVIENQPLNVTCEVSSNPQPDQISWSPSGEMSVPSTLYFSSISRNKSGTYRCTATNTMTSTAGTQKTGTNTSQIMVDVLYPPSIHGLTSAYKVIENEPLNVSCEAKSNPAPDQISWSPSGESSVQSILYFSSVSRNKSGTYSCKAQNTMITTAAGQQTGTNTRQIQVDVMYGAAIVNLSVHDGDTVNESSRATFKCHVDSNPPSTITWMKDSSSTVLQTEPGVVKSQYIIESAECLDMGNYSCSAYNAVWTQVNETVQFFVRCHPRTDFRLALETRIYRKRHEPAVLRYTVIAYPPPTFNWTFLRNDSVSSSLPFSASQHDDGYQSELRFTSLDLDDFGYYSVIADNSLFPSAREVFEIVPEDVPETPSNLMIVEITQTTVKVQWLAGDNGGPQQTFYVVSSADRFTQNVSVADPGYRQNGTAVLEGLLPKTKYQIYVIASNSVGSSNMSEVLIATTLEVRTDSGNSFPYSAVAGGIGAGVVVIVLVVVALFLWRRYKNHNQHTDGIKQGKKERRRPESGLFHNPVYNSSGTVPCPSVNSGATGVDYAEVVKPKKKAFVGNEPSTAYAQVDKTKKRFQKGDIYENADLVGKCSKSDRLYQRSGNAKSEPSDENFYEDAGVTASNGPLKNKEGLLYADLMLDPPTRRNGDYIIRGIENRAEYADIAYGKRGEPLPESDNETYNCGTAKHADQ